MYTAEIIIHEEKGYWPFKTYLPVEERAWITKPLIVPILCLFAYYSV
jgi:hypothetical protein